VLIAPGRSSLFNLLPRTPPIDPNVSLHHCFSLLSPPPFASHCHRHGVLHARVRGARCASVTGARHTGVARDEGGCDGRVEGARCTRVAGAGDGS
jgi:hypothetical protein